MQKPSSQRAEALARMSRGGEFCRTRYFSIK